MDSNNVINFNHLIKEIENRRILLPDFQRDFKWKEFSQQAGLIASVFARLPIGSILLLNSQNREEYEANEIGCKHTVDWKDEKFDKSTISFLLDGQQRLTVLTNVFSDVIFKNWHDWQRDPLHSSLKKRFFLKIPRWNYDMNEDIYGVKTLDYSALTSEVPSFLSDDVMPFVHYEEVKKGEFNKATNEPPYHPHANPSNDNLRQYCLRKGDYYYIPLYLMYTDDPTHTNMYTCILNSIATDLAESVNLFYSGIEDEKDKLDFVRKFLGERSIEYDSFVTFNRSFEELVRDKASTWKDNLKAYLDGCISKIHLTKITMEDEEKARAINVYERLNEGGVALTTFDLIVAKASSDTRKKHGSFKKRFLENVRKKREYPNNVAPDIIQSILDKIKPYDSYNAAVKMKVIDSNDEVISSYSDTFLSVLSLYCNNKGKEPEGYLLANSKKKAILELTAEQINDNLEKVCESIDRALFFLQIRCGVRYISEINYKNMITVLSVIFLEDKFFKDKNVYNLLEAWYWSSIFSGSYDSDQNSKMEFDIQGLLNLINKRLNGNREKCDWLEDQIEKVLNKEDFSDYATLSMENTSKGHYPKDVLKNGFLQYMLSNTYPFMLAKNVKADEIDENIDKDDRISVFSSHSLDAHHIVPLGSNLSEKMSAIENSLKLREQKDSKYNSPLNYALIDSAENNTILDLPANVYLEQVSDSAKTALFIQCFEPDKIDAFLSSRYKSLKGAIDNEINGLYN